MKFFVRCLRHFLVSLVFGVLAGGFLLSIAHIVCGEANGENAAGGGAAIGMLALAIAGVSLMLAFTVLCCVDLICRFDVITPNQKWKYEVAGIACLLIVLGVVIMQVERSMC